MVRVALIGNATPLYNHIHRLGAWVRVGDIHIYRLGYGHIMCMGVYYGTTYVMVLVGWLARWLAGWLAGWLACWLASWLTAGRAGRVQTGRPGPSRSLSRAGDMLIWEPSRTATQRDMRQWCPATAIGWPAILNSTP